MVAIRAQNATSFLSKPDAAIRAILLFGTDQGLVAERAQSLAQVLARRESPQGEIVRLDEADLDADPDRLAVELLTVPMFGGAKIVRTQQGRRITAAVLKPLVEGPALPGALIVEAGNLKSDEGLRALFEKAPNAAAVGCYADEGATLGQLVDEVLKTAGLRIEPEARQELQGRLGADRALSRGEIEKLALYAAGDGTVTLAHVEAIVGDASELTIDRIIETAAAGNAVAALSDLDRSIASGESPQLLVLALLRHFQRLHRVRADVDKGRSMDEAIRALRPPVFFRARGQIEQQLRRWKLSDLDAALRRLAIGAREARLAGQLEGPVVERIVLDIARLARQAASTKAHTSA